MSNTAEIFDTLGEWKPEGPSLGYTARRRYPKNYDDLVGLFPKPKFEDPKTTHVIDTKTVVKISKHIVLQTLVDSKKISPQLKGKDLNETCKKVWEFFYGYQYKIDEPGTEQLRRPARAFHDRKTGVDCDCFAISVSSVLTNLGIRHYFRVVKMYGNDYYQHIFIVVPKFKNADMSKRENYFVIDPVVDKYDYEPTGITFKTDIEMAIPVQYLNGIEEDNIQGTADINLLGTEFNRIGENISGLGGLGELDQVENEFLGAMQKHLSRTAKLIRSNPKSVSALYKPRETVQAIEGLLGVWDNPEKRDAELDRLANDEENLMQPAFRGLGGSLMGGDESLFGLINATDEELNGIGSPTLGALKIVQKAKAAVQKTVAKAKEVVKNSPAQKVVDKITTVKNNTIQNTKAVAAKAAEKVKATTKKVAQKTVAVAKKVGRAVIKYSPAMLTLRAAVLGTMKTNAGRIASRVYWGYFTQAQANAAGVTTSYWQKALQAKQRLEKTYTQKFLGEESALKQAVITGRGAQVAKSGKLSGIAGLTDLTEQAFASKIVALKPVQQQAAKHKYAAHKKQKAAMHDMQRRSAPNRLMRTIHTNPEAQINGLGAGIDPAMVAALAPVAVPMLKPILDFLTNLFKRKDGKEETPTGKEAVAATPETPTPPTDTTVAKSEMVDKLIEQQNNLVDKLQQQQNAQAAQAYNDYVTATPATNATATDALINTPLQPIDDADNKPKEAGMSTTQMFVIGGLALTVIGGGIYASVNNKKSDKKPAVNGVGAGKCKVVTI